MMASNNSDIQQDILTEIFLQILNTCINVYKRLCINVYKRLYINIYKCLCLNVYKRL